MGGLRGLLGGLRIERQHALVSAPIGPDREQFRFCPAGVGGAVEIKSFHSFFRLEGRLLSVFEWKLSVVGTLFSPFPPLVKLTSSPVCFSFLGFSWFIYLGSSIYYLKGQVGSGRGPLIHTASPRPDNFSLRYGRHGRTGKKGHNLKFFRREIHARRSHTHAPTFFQLAVTRLREAS